MLLMIDNYDSFVYNLVRYIEELGEKVAVFRNDAITPIEAQEKCYKGIIISPGPGAPEQAGNSLEFIRYFAGRLPVLGICLGHQAIGEAFGAVTVKGREPVHGKVSEVSHDGKGLFEGVSNPFMVTRYHSLVLDRRYIPECLEITSEAPDGAIMGIRHRQLPVEGVQFHPEAELTQFGHKMLGNFLKRCNIYSAAKPKVTDRFYTYGELNEN